jgi:hypothetical protein
LQIVGALRYSNAFNGPQISVVLYLLNAAGVFMLSGLALAFGAVARFLGQPNAR